MADYVDSDEESSSSSSSDDSHLEKTRELLSIVLDGGDIRTQGVLESLISTIVEEDEEQVEHINKDGSVSKRRRLDYSRGPKKRKPDDPWQSSEWLLEITDHRVEDPSTAQGAYFRQRFRVPYQIFKQIVEMCRNTNEPEFNYPAKHLSGMFNIPLELKILTSLRILATGNNFSLFLTTTFILL
jgi:hypothetical protein